MNLFNHDLTRSLPRGYLLTPDNKPWGIALNYAPEAVFYISVGPCLMTP